MTQEEVDKALADVDKMLSLLDAVSDAAEELIATVDGLTDVYATASALPLPEDVRAAWELRAITCMNRFARVMERMN